MNAAAQVAPAVPAIGTAHGGGFVTGIIRENGQQYLVITAPAAFELKGKWGEYGQEVEGANSYTDGRANTEAMAAAGSELAKQVLALAINGYSDWAIPARDQQELQYRHFKPSSRENYASFRDGDNPSSVPPGYPYSEESPGQTSVEVFHQGGAEAFAETWYWSSSQYSAYYAYYMYFFGGTQISLVKTNEGRVRPVRRELIQ
ncbi:DUF1566 domain-containing protein [Pseudomonas sp. MOB-449]|nr:DUF1566 domain-containing protein [Pseudomonas sp. MOB-449]